MPMKVFLLILWKIILIKLKTGLTLGDIKGINLKCLHRDRMTPGRKQKANKQKEAQYLDRNANFSFLLHLPCQLPKLTVHMPVGSHKFPQNRMTETSQIKKVC